MEQEIEDLKNEVSSLAREISSLRGKFNTQHEHLEKAIDLIQIIYQNAKLPLDDATKAAKLSLDLDSN